MPVKYHSIQKVIGDLTVEFKSIRKVDSAAERLETFLRWLAGATGGPDNTLPPGSPGSPDNTLPGGGERPDQGLPGGGEKPDQGLPGGGEKPDQGLPGQGGRPSHPISGGGPRPDQGLPGGGQGGTKPVDPDEGSAGQLPTTPGAPGRPMPPSGGTKPVQPDEGSPGQLPHLIGENAGEIAKFILKGTLCDPDKPQPKG